MGTMDYIEFIGLDPQDSAWPKIGYDVVHPKDDDAMKKIRDQLRTAIRRRTKKG